MPKETAQEVLAKAIAQAFRQRASSQSADSGAAFARLAAGQVSHKRRAANLLAQAATSYAHAGNESLALNNGRLALRVFGELEMTWRARAFYDGFVKLLTGLKLSKALDAVRSEYSQKIVIWSDMAQRDPLPSSRLPAACPSCTLPMRADEVDWISKTRAECDYCGIVVDAQP
jgi:hypothetical protein